MMPPSLTLSPEVKYGLLLAAVILVGQAFGRAGRT